MKKFILFFTLCALCTSKFIFAQEEDTTISSHEDSLETEKEDPLKAEIIKIIKEVNKRSAEIDNIISTGEIKVKTPKVDETGSIEIHVKKKDDVWFKIEGPLGIDVACGHFNRERFIFFDDLNDLATTGSTNILNIGQLTRIRCTFDDLLNCFSGTVRIPRGKKDELSITEEVNQILISLKRGTITRKYWIDKENYYVNKYLYINKKGETLISFEFSNFSSYNGNYYARKIEIRRPKQKEYFRITMENVNLNQSYIDLRVEIPSDAKRRNWK